MVKSRIKEMSEFFVERLQEKGLNVSKIVLFGSQATGGAMTTSDVDLVVISKDFHKKDIFKRVDLIREAEAMTIKRFMMPLDVISMTPEEFETEGSLAAAYAKEGEVLYAA